MKYASLVWTAAFYLANDILGTRGVRALTRVAPKPRVYRVRMVCCACGRTSGEGAVVPVYCDGCDPDVPARSPYEPR